MNYDFDAVVADLKARAEAAEVERDEALDYNRACNEMREQHKARLVDEQRRYTEACNNYSTLQLRAEAAEAERDRLAVCCACVVERANEAAEAELAHEFGMRTAWQYRAEAAEARIAAALAYLDDKHGDLRTIGGVRRALTGEAS